MGAEIDRMTHILRLGEDLSDRKAVPAIRPGDVLSAFPYAPALSGEIGGRRLNLPLAEHRGNLIGTMTLNGKLEDTPHDSRRFLVDQPVVFVIGVFLVAVNGTVGGGLAGLALDPDGGALLAAQIPQIPFRHDVQKRKEFQELQGKVRKLREGFRVLSIYVMPE